MLTRALGLLSQCLLISDSVRRFTFTQFIYTLYNRILKKLFRALHRNKQYNLTDQELTDLNTCKERLSQFIIQPNFNETYHSHYHDYHRKLSVNMVSNDDLLNGWKDESDKELNNNFNRFHLFTLLFRRNLDVDFSASTQCWISLFPKAKGSAWNGFNCSLRMFNWLRILSDPTIQSQINSDTWIELQKSLYNQCLYVIKNIEHHIPGNHVLLQYFSTWIVLVSFPEWHLSKKKLQTIERKLLREIELSLKDGNFHIEHSYHYHLQITLVALMVMHYFKYKSPQTSSPGQTTVQESVSTALNFRFPDKYLPMIADNCFCFFNPTPYEDLEQIIHLADRLGIDVSESNGMSVTEHKDHYLIATCAGTKIVFDVGQIGLYANPGHGHSDLSSFVYASQGRTLLIDPGTRNYSNGVEDLELKRASSHNTISINGEDHAKLWGFFRWAYLPNKIKYYYKKNEGTIHLYNEYEGFFHAGGYRHQRSLTLTGDKLIMQDTIHGDGTPDIAINFIFHPDVTMYRINGAVHLRAGECSWTLTHDLRKCSVKTQTIHCYHAYGVPSETSKLTLVVESAKLPFVSTVTITNSRN